MLIRAAQPEDYKGIAKVHVQSWKETYVGLLPQNYLDGLLPEQRESAWKKSLENPNKEVHIFVAVKNEEVIGFVSGGVAREDHGYDGELYAIYLLKEDVIFNQSVTEYLYGFKL